MANIKAVEIENIIPNHPDETLVDQVSNYLEMANLAYQSELKEGYDKAEGSDAIWHLIDAKKAIDEAINKIEEKMPCAL